eukprot:15366854-Ditylum_brightwellii.AAC.1
MDCYGAVNANDSRADGFYMAKWYLGPESGALRTLAKMNNMLVPKVNVTIVSNTSQLGYSLKTILEDDMKKRKAFQLSDDGYEAIMEDQMRQSPIEYT